ncbi:MAG: DUF370 domain-containing protein [Clostridia bacterium]|nr:DUF370 domain-containing protein [Clostridia bacterium]
MYLHVGNNKNIRISSILGIFDMDNSTVSAITRRFLSIGQKKMIVESAGFEIPKSFVVYKEKNEYRICFSQLSTGALKGRLEGIASFDVENENK